MIQATQLYKVNVPWDGTLSLSARPRGGDWLEDEIADWKQQKADVVVSLLTEQEEQDLCLEREGELVRKRDMTFISFPIEDRQVPPSAASVAELVHKMKVSLDAGKHVIVHCRQGIGRTGLIAACLLAESGMETGAALDLLSAARGLPIPETMEQKAWVERFAGKEPVSA